MKIQNEKPAVEDIQPVIDERIVNTVFAIFDAVLRHNSLQDMFEDLANCLIADLTANSFMEFNLELKEEQKAQLRKAVKIKGNETVRKYLAEINSDERAREVYGIVRGKTTEIVDSVLSAIGREINRGILINAVAVQANAKNENHDEILLRKSKTSGDITIPTHCLLISTNCVAAIKASCQEEAEPGASPGSEKKPGGKAKPERAAADRPAKVGK